jgi:hypothetical protein
MPFTFSHPLYALPLKRLHPKVFNTTGLVLGSMSPDFEYFLFLEPYRSIGHTAAGLFVQAIPLSVLFAFLFHRLVKRPLAVHLPSVWNLDRRAFHSLEEWELRGVKDWLVFIGSVIIGFISHIIVDGFTHAHAFFVERLPLLSETVLLDLPLYKILQYGLSLLGLAAIALIILVRLYKSDPRNGRMPAATAGQKWRFWTCAAAIALAVTAVKIAWNGGGNIVGILFVAPISGFALGLVAASMVSRRSAKV